MQRSVGTLTHRTDPVAIQRRAILAEYWRTHRQCETLTCLIQQAIIDGLWAVLPGHERARAACEARRDDLYRLLYPDAAAAEVA